jgi:HSP20 family protein
MSILNRNLPSKNNFGDLFDRFQKEFFSPELFKGIGEGFVPKVEVKETDNSYEVSAELPGMKEEDINITMKGDSLILEGEKKSERKEDQKGYYASEFSYGSFYRTIPLKDDVNEEDVRAEYKDGVLKVHLQKLAENKKKNRKIQINH